MNIDLQKSFLTIVSTSFLFLCGSCKDSNEPSQAEESSKTQKQKQEEQNNISMEAERKLSEISHEKLAEQIEKHRPNSETLADTLTAKETLIEKTIPETIPSKDKAHLREHRESSFPDQSQASANEVQREIRDASKEIKLRDLELSELLKLQEEQKKARDINKALLPSEPNESIQKQENVSDQEILLSLINKGREQRGLPTLKWDNRLNASAQAHVKEIASTRVLSHDSLDGARYWERMYRHGFPKKVGIGVAENIGDAGDPRIQYNAWKEHPQYNINMHHPKINRAGLARQGRYWVLNMGR